jgi:uncharacterized membrane protein
LPRVTSNRLETFSDGVFAIAATLLILNVDTQVGEDVRDLGDRLLHVWPSYVAYAVSFLTIGIMWVNHHTVMDQIGTVDRRFLFLTVGLLMCIAFVPFPTRLVAEHVREGGSEAATLLYGINMTITAVFFNAVWRYGSGRLLHADADPRVVAGITRSYNPGPFIYGGATLVALVSPIASAVLYALIALFYVVESSFFARSASP